METIPYKAYTVTLKYSASCYQVPYGAKFYRENIDEFDEFPAIHQYFPYQNFLFS